MMSQAEIVISDSDDDKELITSDNEKEVNPNIQLSKNEWRILSGNGWFTDKIINNYLGLLKDHLTKSGRNVVILSSHFTQKLMSAGYSGVSRWYRKVKMMDADHIITVFHHGRCHWTMMVIQPKRQMMTYYDSYGAITTPYFKLMKSYFHLRLGIQQDTWQCNIADDVPKQSNASDCGVFILEYARCLLLSHSMDFTQEGAASIRLRMKKELQAAHLSHNPGVENNHSELHVHSHSGNVDGSHPSHNLGMEIDHSEMHVHLQASNAGRHQVESKTSTDDNSDEENTSNELFSPMPRQWDELNPTLQSVLPPDYTYLVESYDELPKGHYTGAPKARFQTHFRVNVQNEEQVQGWMKAFQSHSKCTYRVTRTYKPSMKRVKYKLDLHCQHFQKKLTNKQLACAGSSKRKPLSLVSNLRKKKTQCSSTLSITVQVPSKMQLQKAPQGSRLAEHQALMKLTFDHNHSLESAHALSFRPVAPATREKYYSLFNMGHSAASARYYYETLILENEEDAQHSLADQAVNPNAQDVSRLFNLWRQTQLGDDNGIGLFERLQEEVEAYNARWGEDGGKAKLQRFTRSTGSTIDSDEEEMQGDDPPKAKRPKRERSEPLILALCTPLMARAHTTLPQSAEIMFCDSTSSLDRFNTSLFMLSTCHPAGGIPLGILMTSDEKEDTIHAALKMLADILPKGAFYGKGAQKGPAVIMTDDSMSERGALNAMWPTSTSLLCIFHFLQSKWTWL